jgi:hypothetical protein
MARACLIQFVQLGEILADGIDARFGDNMLPNSN